MKKAIVTGHSRGLGAAIAEALLSRGFAVLGLARQRNDELARYQPANLSQVALDLADPAALSQWLDGGALREFLAGAEAALLVNNAGVVAPIGALGTQDVGAVARAVTLNVAAPLMLASAFAAATDAGAAEGGAAAESRSDAARRAPTADRRILHVSSGAGRNALASWSVYCATKAALDHHARTVALDGTPGLRICSLAPGIIDTDMQADIRGTPPERFPQWERFQELKRDGALTTPEDCARRLVDYLLSEVFGRVPVADLREVAAAG
ncbi:MAG: SDR family oxidoreductase [Burkholderiales bacterium]|nr:MAG: SDR family oxidoreductase [Burkholderiales bacterium]